jgi:hypothetical protein
VDTEGRRLGDPEGDLRYLNESAPPGEIDLRQIERLFEARFEDMRLHAMKEAERWLRSRANELRVRRAEQAAILRQDLKVDVADRMREIDEEENQARGLARASAQLPLFAEESGPGGFNARRAAVKSYAGDREEEIAAFEQVAEPAPPRSLGALFLVPKGGPP